jgi:hypothetical protein
MRIGRPVPAPLGTPTSGCLRTREVAKMGSELEMEGGEIQVGGVLDGHGTERTIV